MQSLSYFYSFRFMFLLIFFSTSVSFCSKGNNMLEIGNEVSPDFLKKLDKESSMTASGAITNIYKLKIKNIDYYISLNKDNKIKYIETKDINFKTSEGFKVGTTLGEIQASHKSDILEEKGWAYYVPLKSGWNAAFVEGEFMTDKNPSKNSRVIWFFKK